MPMQILVKVCLNLETRLLDTLATRLPDTLAGHQLMCLAVLDHQGFTLDRDILVHHWTALIRLDARLQTLRPSCPNWRQYLVTL